MNMSKSRKNKIKVLIDTYLNVNVMTQLFKGTKKIFLNYKINTNWLKFQIMFKKINKKTKTIK
jgi:hypothetical protein